MTPDRLTVVRDAQADRPGALDRLVDHWLPVVLRWCIRLGGSGVNAEDAAQDTFETMFERLPTLREPDVFPAWLYGITRRTLARHRRRAWVRRWVPGLAIDAADPNQNPAADAERGQTVERVWAALGRLPDHHREVLVLSDLEDRPDSEVAEMIGIPRATVKSRLRRARAALRTELGELAPAVITAADLGES